MTFIAGLSLRSQFLVPGFQLVVLSGSVLEELHRPLALLGLVARLERAKVSASAGLRIPFP